jgi:hypothetical protein
VAPPSSRKNRYSSILTMGTAHRNVGKFIPHYKFSHPPRRQPSVLPPSELHISQYLDLTALSFLPFRLHSPTLFYIHFFNSLSFIQTLPFYMLLYCFLPIFPQILVLLLHFLLSLQSISNVHDISYPCCYNPFHSPKA